MHECPESVSGCIDAPPFHSDQQSREQSRTSATRLLPWREDAFTQVCGLPWFM